MAHIVIDARPINTSTGRYLRGLIDNLAKLDSGNRYTILTWSDFDKSYRQWPANFTFQTADYPINGSPREQLGLLKRLNGLNADLVHFGMPQQPALYRGAKITTIHDLSALRFVNPVKNRAIFNVKQKVFSYIVKQAAKESAYVITPSEYVKYDVAQYANIDPGKVCVTYEAADRITAPVQPINRLKGKRFIMYIGRANPHKNLRRLVEAFIILKRKDPELMLVLAGKMDSSYKRLEAYVTTKRMADSIVFSDYVTEGELKWLYMNTLAYVFPSLSEGFGLPGLEAMVHGAPVVSSNATSLPEIYGNAAYYFDPTNVFDIAAKVGDVVGSAGLRGELIQKGHARAATFSWQKMARQTLQLYEKALKD